MTLKSIRAHITPEREIVVYFLVVFTAVLLSYTATLCPTIYGGDSGELAAVVHTMGIAHPPGHPLYVVTAKLFSILFPFGDLIFRLNFMSAFFGALACSMFFLSARHLVMNDKFRNIISFFCALVFGFSLSAWNFALFAETYSLNVFFLSVLVFLILRIIKSGEKDLFRLSSVFFFIWGLSTGNHPSIIVWMLGFGLILLLHKGKKVLAPGYIFWMFMFFVIGFSIYLYLPLRARFNPQFDLCRITSWKKFFSTLLIRQYRQRFIAPETFLAKARKGGEILTSFGNEYTFPMAGILIFACISFFKRNKKIFSALMIQIAFLLIFALQRQGAVFSIDYNSYIIPVIFVLTLTFPVFLDVLTMFISRIQAFKLRGAAFGCGILLLLVFLGVEYGTNYRLNDKSNEYLPYDMGIALLETMEPGSIIFLQKDWSTFSLAYLQTVEGRRPDIKIYNRSATMFPNLPGLHADGVAGMYNVIKRSHELEDRFIINNPDKHIYFNLPKDMKKLRGRYRLFPKGVLYKVVPFDYRETEPRDLFLLYNIRWMERPREEWDFASSKILIDYYLHLAEYYFEIRKTEKALSALEEAGYFARNTFSEMNALWTVYIGKGYYNKALSVLKEQIEILPGYAPTYKNLAIVYANYLRDLKSAVYYLEKYLETDPNAYDKDQVVRVLHQMEQEMQRRGRPL